MKKFTQKIIFLAIFAIVAISIVVYPQISNSIYAYKTVKSEFSQKSIANDNAAGDRFGSSVAMTSKYALIGSTYNDDKGLMDSGSAYLFDIFTGKQLHKLIAKDDAAGDQFGSSIAMASKYALIGSIYGDDKGLTDSGSAYLFNIFTGKQLQKFTADDAGAGNQFGSSVAMASKYALIGSIYGDDKGLTDSGSVYLFDIFTGKQLQKFTADDAAAGNQFGSSVAIDGKYALIGSTYADDKGLTDSGSAYLFDIFTGKQLQKFTADDTAAGDLFGSSVAIDGRYALVGSAYDDDKGLTDSGSAYLFDVFTGKQLQKFIANDDAAGDLFGSSVAIDGRYALVGSAYDDDKGLMDSGSAYLFDIITGKQLQKFTADNAAGDRFGSSVAIADKYALIGSAYDDDKGLVDSGSAYLFNIFTGKQLQKF